MSVTSDPRRLGGVARLYGEDGAARLARAHVVVAGAGGVGSWAMEALARSGIGRLTLIDGDVSALSNTNRQLHAMDGNYGRGKVALMRERIGLINPDCRVELIESFITPENAEETGGDMTREELEQLEEELGELASSAIEEGTQAAKSLDPELQEQMDKLVENVDDHLQSMVADTE